MEVKAAVFGFLGLIGGAITNLLGGWDTAMQTLLIFMAVDYITGLILRRGLKRVTKATMGHWKAKRNSRAFVKKVLYY